MVSTVSMPSPGPDEPVRGAAPQAGQAESQPRKGGCPTRVEVAMPRYLFDRLTEHDKAPRCRYETARGVAEFVAAPGIAHDSQALLITRLFVHIEVALADAGRFPTHLVALSSRLLSPDGAFEPDTSIFVDPVRAIRAGELGLGANAIAGYLDTEKGHPVPDLVVEVDRSADSSHKLVPYFRMGVREVWTWNSRDGVVIWIADDNARGEPAHATQSRIFPGLDREGLDSLLTVGSGFEERFHLSRELAGRVVAERLGAESAQ